MLREKKLHLHHTEKVGKPSQPALSLYEGHRCLNADLEHFEGHWEICEYVHESMFPQDGKTALAVLVTHCLTACLEFSPRSLT